MDVSACPTFELVKAILDRLVEGRTENLRLIHGDSFGWSTKAELLAAEVHPGGSTAYRLIDPVLAAAGRARETFLYVALYQGVGDFSRMPLDGPYALPEDMNVIEAWINGGMPD